MSTTSDGTRTWQEDVTSALAADPSHRVRLGTAATVWAVRSRSEPHDHYNLVIVFGMGTQSLKVCCVPCPEDRDEDTFVGLKNLPQGHECLLVARSAEVSAVPDPIDEHSFLYEVDAAEWEGRAIPCLAYRFRDHCWHVDQCPGETIRRMT